MTGMTQLLNLLPTLALVGMALSGVEQMPTALAHRPVARTPKDLYHKHMAARQRLEDNVHKKRGAKTLLRRQADGSKCRVRGQPANPAAPAQSATSSAAPAPAPAPTDASFTDVATAAPTDSASSSAVESWSESATSSSAAPAPPAATPPASTGINSGSKYGAAWPNGDWAQPTDPNYIGNYIGNRLNWYYTWSPFAVGSGDQLGLEFVPMLWGPGHVSDWYAQMGTWPSSVRNALFFNEPNQQGQCDVSAQDAVQYWMNDFLPVRSKGIRLGDAAVTNAPSGLQWIQDFRKACTGAGNSDADCTPDFIPVHYYDTDVTRFQEYVTNFHDQTGINLWVTEYACQDYNGGAQCSDQDSWNFHTQMAGWFDAQPWIERYSPFGMMKDMQGVNQNNALMNPDGSITSLGGWYATTA